MLVVTADRWLINCTTARLANGIGKYTYILLLASIPTGRPRVAYGANCPIAKNEPMGA